MQEHALFTQSRDKLLRTAGDLGIADASVLTTAQLVDAIAAAQAAQAHGIPWVQTPRGVFRRAEQLQRVLIRNPAARPVRLRLEAMDPNGVFVIPPQFQDIVLQGKATLSVPVRFSVPTPSRGFLITNSAHYTGGIEIQDDAGQIVDVVKLSATGPGYQTDPCMVSPHDVAATESSFKSDEPETRSRWTMKVTAVPVPDPRTNVPGRPTGVVPETAWRGERVLLEWQVSAEPPVDFKLWHSLVYFDPDYLPDGENPTVYGLPSKQVLASGSREFPEGCTIRADFRWETEHGGHAFWRWIRRRIRLNYGWASTPAPVHESECNLLQGYLLAIEAMLKEHRISGNADLDRFHDPYLRDPGPDGLEQHMLNKMQQVLIFTSRDYLPYSESHRDLLDPSHHPLCDTWIDPQGRQNAVYGKTPGDQSWVGICRELGGDDLTLLHELYHYSSARDWGNECKACVVSWGCYYPQTPCPCWDWKLNDNTPSCGDIYPPL